MGLAADIYAVLNTDWSTGIIAKPTFHKNEQDPRPESRHFFINAKDSGDFVEDSSDNSSDLKNQPFTLTFYEGDEDDIVKSIRAAKKALHEKVIANGYYHVDSFDMNISNQLSSCTLKGNLNKIIGDDEF